MVVHTDPRLAPALAPGERRRDAIRDDHLFGGGRDGGLRIQPVRPPSSHAPSHAPASHAPPLHAPRCALSRTLCIHSHSLAHPARSTLKDKKKKEVTERDVELARREANRLNEERQWAEFTELPHGQSAAWAVPQLGSCASSSAPVPPQGTPGGSGRLGTPRARPGQWDPSHCLGCSS